MNALKGVKGFASIPLEERFWAKVEKTDGCWRWIGSTDGRGYGVVWKDGRKTKAHVASWEMANSRSRPDGLVVMHRCDNKICVRPEHLELGTNAQNVQDAYDRGLGKQKKRTATFCESARTMRATGMTMKEIAAAMGVTMELISRALAHPTKEPKPQ
jgi:hypothetical protein